MTEVEALIEDLGLIPLSSQEAQDLIRVQLSRNVHDVQFEEACFAPLFGCSVPSSSPVYPGLDKMYHKYNSKGKRRSFGSSFDLQLKLDF